MIEESKIKDIERIIDKLKEEVSTLKQSRVSQTSIIPGAIKMRHMGEGNRFIRGGATAGKPTIGENATDSVAIYFDTTTNKLYIYNPRTKAWVSTTLS